MSRHLQHIKSSQANKAPLSNDLLYGEIAVNYAEGSETLYIKNSSNTIVPFINGNKIKQSEEIIAQSLADLNERSSSNKTNINALDERLTTAESEIVSAKQSIEDNELVTANALIDLNERIDLKADAETVNDSIESLGARITQTNQVINDNERVIAQALSVLNRRLDEFDAMLRAIEAALSEI